MAPSPQQGTDAKAVGRGAVLAAIVVAIAIVVTAAPRVLTFWRSAEDVVSDTRLATLSPAPGAPKIVVVTITEETLAALPYRSPFDRRYLAELVTALGASGVSVLGIDILFDRPTEPAKDGALMAAFHGFKAPIVLAWADTRHGLEDLQAAFLDAFTEEAGVKRGLSVFETDSDGTVRRLPRIPAGEMQPFAAVIAAEAGAAAASPPGRIAYLRPAPDGASAVPTIPAQVVLTLAKTRPALLSAMLRGKIALIGADLPHDDRHRTPLGVIDSASNGLPGVVIHAQALDQILDGRRIREGGWEFEFILALLAAGWGVVATMRAIASWARTAALAAGLGLLWLGGFAAFLWASLLVPVVSPTIALGLGYGIASAYAYRRERQARAFIRGAFARFVPPAVVDALQKNPALLRLGGERRELTFLVTDVADFTVFVERLSPGELVVLMNDYLDGLSKIVLRHGGTIAKFMGDGMFAFFGAPLEQPDHAQRAVACAIAIDHFAERFCTDHPGFGRTRIGVNTGVAVVGNFGGKDRFDYTALGDAANTAARLESANKFIGTRIAISATTVRACPNTAVRPVGVFALKGKSEVLSVFEPIAEGMAKDILDRYRAAYDCLATGDRGAIDAFRALAAADPLAAFHLARLERGEWGTLVRLETK